MDLPKGQPIKENVKIDNLIFEFQNLVPKDFSGYIAICGNGYGGIERAILVFNAGKIIMAEYCHMRFGKELFGDKALQYIFNLMKLPTHVVDLIAFDEKEMYYVVDINKKYILSKEIYLQKILKMLPRQYNKELIKKIEDEMIERLHQQDTLKIHETLGEILKQTRDRDYLIKKWKIHIDYDEIERLVLKVQGQPIETQEFKIKKQLIDELNTIDCFDLINLLCRIYKEKVKIIIEGRLHSVRMKPPITNQEIFEQVVQKLARKIIDSTLENGSSYQIEIEYKITRV